MNRNKNPLFDRWNVPVTVEDLPDAGGHYELNADAPTREAVAKIAGLRALSRFEAVFDVERGGAGVRVSGQVNALATQTCVVTLDPIETDVAETVDLLFAPVLESATKETKPRRRKKSDEPPEPLVNGVIDLSAVATEFLILGLDPYPRKAGVAFTQPNPDDGAAHPFAALEALKKRSGSDLK
jgi:uncharacterized metal-binding protein YceD (DUF177 family)